MRDYRPTGPQTGVREASRSTLGDQPYEQVLTRVQEGLSATAVGSLEEVSEAELKERIERHLTDNRIRCSLTPDQAELVNYIYHDMAGYSFITRDDLFHKPGFEEININAWNDVEIMSAGRRVKTDYSFLSPQHAIDIHTRMLRRTKTTLNNAVPRATADIGEAIRITVVKEPIVDKNVAVASSIRKVNLAAASEDILLDNDSLTPEMMDFLILCLAHGVSICISGETGAGKTTLGGCLLAIASKTLRIVTIEEGSREWNLVIEKDGKILNSVIHMRTQPDLGIGQEELVKDSLRFDPDIIAPSEVRGKESFEVMGASNTGHTVITTTHSNGTADTPQRLVDLAKKAYDMSDSTLNRMAGRAFPILVHMEKGTDRKRRVTEIREVLGYEDGELQSQMLYEFEVEDNIYKGDECVRVAGGFTHHTGISPALVKKLLKKGATRAELKPYAEPEGRKGKQGVA
ncbi:MAG: ATPase, T2SS/T4P/T4SS family [Lawsonibacter sp.]